MFSIEELEEKMNSDSFKDYMSNYFKEREEKYNRVSSDEYIQWLYSYLNHEDILGFSDDDMQYAPESEDRENSLMLSYFLSYVEELAKKQRVLNVPDEENEFETTNYVIKINDMFIEVSTMCGQGSVSFAYKVNKPDFCYVTVK